MTTSFLRRNLAFEQLGDRVVDVLTFDAALHYPRLEERLRQRGMLSPNARIINIWDWLRGADTPQAAVREASVDLDSFAPLDTAGDYETGERDGSVLTRTRKDADGVVLQVDHYRGDGTLLASDRRDVERRDRLGGRSVVLCDRAGSPRLAWPSSWGLFRYWLDLVRHEQAAIMLIDSKTVANMMLGYRRRGVRLVHIIHGSHLNDRGDRLRASRKNVFSRLREFDLVVALTERQRRDVAAMHPRAANLVAVPNSVGSVPADACRAGRTSTAAKRAAGSIAVLASLIPRKRVDHAIAAVAGARAASDAEVNLAVYGEGAQRAGLQAQIETLQASVFVTLAGHLPDARDALESTSFLLLTSRSEGFGLVLLEAMAAGCIPIAYDVPYGPSDVIADRWNGFLVPAGDTAALESKIVAASRLSVRELELIRANGRATAERYSDAAVMELWTAALARRPSYARAAVRRLRRFGVRVGRRLRRFSTGDGTGALGAGPGSVVGVSVVGVSDVSIS